MPRKRKQKPTTPEQKKARNKRKHALRKLKRKRQGMQRTQAIDGLRAAGMPPPTPCKICKQIDHWQQDCGQRQQWEARRARQARAKQELRDRRKQEEAQALAHFDPLAKDLELPEFLAFFPASAVSWHDVMTQHVSLLRTLLDTNPDPLRPHDVQITVQRIRSWNALVTLQIRALPKDTMNRQRWIAMLVNLD